MNKELEQLKKQVQANIKKLDNHLELIQKNSYALDILKDYKKGYKSAYILLVIFASGWILTTCVLIYLITLLVK